jgi:hypothetical protein
VRFEWYVIEGGSGSIGRVVIKNKQMGVESDKNKKSGSGSGRVAVVPLDRGGQRGSNGGCLTVAVAVPSES